jgi:hypothetical protein
MGKAMTDDSQASWKRYDTPEHDIPEATYDRLVFELRQRHAMFGPGGDDCGPQFSSRRTPPRSKYRHCARYAGVRIK